MNSQKHLALWTGILLMFIAYSSASANGLLVANSKEPLPPLSVEYQRVDIHIDNQIANTKVEQVFINNTSRVLEGTYIFPLNEQASISDYAIWENGKKLVGRIEEKHEARRIYRKLTGMRIDPGLLEYMGRNRFQTRVYPIPAKGTKQLELRYAEVLPYDDGLVTYRYPLFSGGYENMPLGELRISIVIEDDKPITQVYSETHNISVSHKGENKVKVSFEMVNFAPKRDFVLHYRLASKNLGVSFLVHREKGEEGYFMLRVSPQELTAEADIAGKDVNFIFDTSGSMQGAKIAQAKRTLRTCMELLNPNDKFNLICFNDEVNPFEKKLVKAGGENVKGALEFISKIEAAGGTDLDMALRKGLKQFEQDKQPDILIFLTDGRDSTSPDILLKNVAKANLTDARIFVFGVGSDVNSTLLKQIALAHKGAAEYITEGEAIDTKVSQFYRKISKPVLTDVGLDFGKMRTRSQYPRTLPHLYKGSQLILVGKYRDSGKANLTLKGKLHGNEKNFKYEVEFPKENTDNRFIARLWAKRRSEHLISEIRLNGMKPELRDEIIRLSKRYKFITPYTSFIATDEEPTADSRQATQKVTRLKTTFFSQKSSTRKPAMRKPAAKLLPKPAGASSPTTKSATAQPRLTTANFMVRTTVKSQTVIEFSGKHISFDTYVAPVVVEQENTPKFSIGPGDYALAPLERGEPGGTIIGRGRDIPAPANKIIAIPFQMSQLHSMLKPLSITDIASQSEEKRKRRGIAFIHYAVNTSESKEPIALQRWIIEKSNARFIIAQNKSQAKELVQVLEESERLRAEITGSSAIDNSLRRLRYPSMIIIVTDKPIFWRKSQIEHLRKYLIEKNGFLLIIRTGGGDETDTSIREKLRRIVCEYKIEPMETSHDIYQHPYKLSTSVTEFHAEGICVADRLCVLYTTHNHWKAWCSDREEPSELRFGANVIHYAISHNRIADNSNCSLGWSK